MLLELLEVGKDYPSGDGRSMMSILDRVSLAVASGSSVGIMGPSGSGKSTLLNIVGGLDRPSSGKVLLDGRDLASLSEPELARARNRDIGFVFQLHHLLPQCTVLENVLVPTLVREDRNPPADMTRARKLLDRVGLTARAHHVPGRLSGGECQRTAVVRALINSPKLLLADEPTGSLDPASAGNLAQLLVDLNREEGTALIVVTHSTALAGRMARRFSLTGGMLTPT